MTDNEEDGGKAREERNKAAWKSLSGRSAGPW